MAAIQRTCAALSSKFLISLLTMWTAAFRPGYLRKGRVVLGVVVANCSGDHSKRMRAWRHSLEALKRFLRGGFGLVSVRFQDNAGLYGTAVAVKNKPAPDNPSPTRIFSEPITIIALSMSHEPNMTWPLGNFQSRHYKVERVSSTWSV